MLRFGAGGSGTARDPDRERRAVPRRAAGRDAARDPRTGGRASQLVDGRQNLGRFGDDDEQGNRTARGGAAVPRAPRPERDNPTTPDGDSPGERRGGRVYSTAA